MLLGFWNAAKALARAQQIDILLALDVEPDPRVQLLAALGWAVLLGASAFALWRRRPFVRSTIPGLLFLYFIYELAMVWAFVQVPVSTLSWIVRILLAVLAPLFAWWALKRPPNRDPSQSEGGPGEWAFMRQPIAHDDHESKD